MSALALLEAPAAAAGKGRLGDRFSFENPPLPDERCTIAGERLEVMAAWRLVYETYRRTGLIDGKPHGLHFPSQAVSPNTIVVLHEVEGELASTISAYADGPQGLPLDSIYQEELDALRAEGRHMVEVGMLAHRDPGGGSSIKELADLMRFPFYFTRLSGRHDLVIGVHPHHVRFYERLFGFEQAGPLRYYPLVKDHPAVLLRLDVNREWAMAREHKGSRRCQACPVEWEKFERRFRFTDAQIAGTPLAWCESEALQHVA